MAAPKTLANGVGDCPTTSTLVASPLLTPNAATSKPKHDQITVIVVPLCICFQLLVKIQAVFHPKIFYRLSHPYHCQLHCSMFPVISLDVLSVVIQKILAT